jgi:hypothetical protein
VLRDALHSGDAHARALVGAAPAGGVMLDRTG